MADVEKHSSQTDAAKGFGGKYGVQKDRQDKVCYPQSKWLIYFWEEGDQLSYHHPIKREKLFSQG